MHKEILIEDLKKKITQSPDTDENYRALANIYVADEDYDSALKVYERLLERFPEDMQALINTGSIYFYKKDYERAIENYLKANKLDPSSYAVNFNLGNVYAEVGSFSNALKYYNNSLEIKSDSPDVLFGKMTVRHNLF